MTITKNADGENLTLTIDGRIDTITAPEFEKEIDAIADVTQLVLDFSGVEYISSAGLRVVLKAQKLMNQKGKMKLINVNDDVMDVFDITGFLDILTIE
jgi:anti-sigma B factor antagonist